MFREINPYTINYNINTNDMTYKEIICHSEIKNQEVEYLRKMHHLRYEVFVKKLKWNHGLDVIDEMEFDEFDDFNCMYLINTDENGNVNASMRFIETEKKYLLGDKYSHFVENMSVPRDKNISEVTRFAVNISQDKKMFSKGIAAMINWGMEHDLKYIVSLTRVGMLRALKQIGWDPQPLGEPQNTPNDVSIALQYSVNKEMLNSVCTKNDLSMQSIRFAPHPV